MHLLRALRILPHLRSLQGLRPSGEQASLWSSLLLISVGELAHISVPWGLGRSKGLKVPPPLPLTKVKLRLGRYPMLRCLLSPSASDAKLFSDRASVSPA